MKVKSLLLGSVAAAGLSTGAFAADLASVVSSFDVCENLGMSGLTISSNDDCLQISGGVTYEFRWGDYAGGSNLTGTTVFHPGESRTIIDNGGVAGSELDWRSRLNWWLQFVGAASSDFGTAKAVIKLASDDEDNAVTNEVQGDHDANDVFIKEAYVSIGDTTKIVAGRRDSSVYLTGDDTPFGFIGLFHSDEVDAGVDVLKDHVKTKGHVIQLYHTVGDTGLTVSVGLENLNGSAVDPRGPSALIPFAGLTVAGLTTVQAAGSLVGTVAYASDALTGHISVGAGGILDGTIEDWKVHAGFTGTFDAFKVRGAFAGGSSEILGVRTTAWNGLVSAEASFDMFTLAAAFEAANLTQGATNVTQWGGSVTGSAAVTDQVTVAAGFRWFDSDTSTTDSETYQGALKLIAKLTETLTATGEVGYYKVGSAIAANGDGAFYGAAELAWTPGGQFTSSIKGELNSLGGYKATFKASKTFD